MKKVHLVILFILSFVLTKGQILVNAGWETGDILQSTFSKSSLAYIPQNGYPNGYSARIDSSIARLGNKSVKFELRSTDSSVSSGKRAELTMTSTNPLNSRFRWFAWSEYLPVGYVNDTRAEIHFQIADNTGLTAPNIGLWLRNNKWYFNQKYNIGAGNVEIQTEITNSTINTGRWDDWVLYYKPAIDSTGQITLWRNGVIVFSTTGPNANAQSGVLVPSRYPKFGIYKWPWNTPGTYTPNVRVTYFDVVRYGDSTATYNDFVIPKPLGITGFNPSSGTTGTEVSISGFGFTGVDSVKFGGVLASTFSIVNDSLIKATVASGSSGKIIIDRTDSADTSVTNFTYSAPTPPPPTSQFVVRSDWDSTSDISQGGVYNLNSYCTIDGVTISQNASYSVPRSLMFRLRTSDPTCLSSKRSQIHISSSNNFLDTVEKYQFALYYPSSFVSDSREESHFAIYFGALTNTPTVQLLVVNDKIYLRQTFDSSCSAPVTRTFFLANVVRNQWVVWTFDFVRNSTSRGILRVYRNKTKLFERFAPNINGSLCSTGTRPIPAFGIVKPAWLTTGRYTPSSRLIYLDAVKLAGRSTSITTMLNQVK